jgi:hypothetical protein
VNTARLLNAWRDPGNSRSVSNYVASTYLAGRSLRPPHARRSAPGAAERGTTADTT